MVENKLLSLRIEPHVYKEIDGFAKLWNLSRMDLAKKFLRDSLEMFKKPTLDLALEKVEKGILSTEEAAKLIDMHLDEFEKNAGEAGIIDYFEPEEVKREIEISRRVFDKFKWKQ
jgi:predicted HTH domain antitoxin